VRVAEGYLAQIQTAKKAEEFEQESASRREDKSVGSVINLIEVGGSQQVMLSVTVAEIARTEVKRLNANFNAIHKGSDGAWGGVNGGATFPDALFAPDDVRLPALPGSTPWGPAIDEFAPNPLTIINQGLFGTFIDDDFLFNPAIDAAKEKARACRGAYAHDPDRAGSRILSGGQFRIPVSNGLNGVTVEFKKFGVGLKFLPVVLSDGRINLKINVSVSELVDTASLIPQTEGASLRTFVPPP
jgi:pilus assembly protein CpaC